ncbi:MAG: hypothetical protein Q9160_008753 [Pyrenula sp. 1 TL-2023]
MRVVQIRPHACTRFHNIVAPKISYVSVPRSSTTPSVLRQSISRRAQLRQATTSASTPADPGIITRLRNVFYGATFILTIGLGYLYITDTRASFHRWVAIPALRTIYQDPEDAHHAGNAALKALWQCGLYPRERGAHRGDEDLSIEVFGHKLVNPIATSGGIDKNADIPNPLFAIGPSIVEVGGATPYPQEGNAKPRVFRVPSQNALINRYGLNSEGADHMAMRLRHRVREFASSIGLGHDDTAEQYVLDGHADVPPGSLIPGRLLAVQIAKNKFTPEGDVDAVAQDYVYCVDRLAPYADILVVNVSSPNTPGLRSLQQSDPLSKILSGVVEAAKRTKRRNKPAVMVKVSPDEDSDEQIAGICKAVWSAGVDGVIVGNTTKRRPELSPEGVELTIAEQQILAEQGGYSGPHNFARTVDLVKRYRPLLDRPPPTSLTKRNTAPGNVETNYQPPDSSAPSREEPPEVAQKIKESIDTAKVPFSDPSDLKDEEKASLWKLPDSSKERLHAIGEAIKQIPEKIVGENPDSTSAPPPKPETDQPKVIFATGGISNGQQALEVLNAGASIAMVYTALVYGGVGTISRIKDEMREDIQKQSKRE